MPFVVKRRAFGRMAKEGPPLHLLALLQRSGDGKLMPLF
ncbi:hypothetical protein ACZ87_02204, partial [Candidatus Erwinia dacicola]